MSLCQPDYNFLFRSFQRFDGELADKADFVLHVYFEIIGFQNGFREIEYFHKLAGCQPMIEVISKPGLQTTVCVIAKRSPAVNEPFINSSHFRDVRMGWNGFPVRQCKTEIRVRAPVQFFFKFS